MDGGKAEHYNDGSHGSNDSGDIDNNNTGDSDSSNSDRGNKAYRYIGRQGLLTPISG